MDAAAQPRYTPVSKQSTADEVVADDREGLVGTGDGLGDAEGGREDGGRRGAAGCDCLTQLFVRIRAGRQYGYAAPSDGVIEPLTQDEEDSAGESDVKLDEANQRGGFVHRGPAASPIDGSVPATDPAAAGHIIKTICKSATGFGMVISPNGTVASVDLDGPAARAGITANARIIAVEGVPVAGRDEIIHKLRRLDDAQATFTLVDDTRQWPDLSKDEQSDGQDPQQSVQLAAPPPPLHPSKLGARPPPLQEGPLQPASASVTNSPTAADTPTTTATAQEPAIDENSALRTKDALDSLVGKEAARVKKTVLQPQERLLKAGSLNKMGDVRMQSRQFFLFESALLFTKPAKAPKLKKRGGSAKMSPSTYEIRRTVEADELGRARVSSLACCEDGMADAPFGFRLFLDNYDTALYANNGDEVVEWLNLLGDVLRAHRPRRDVDYGVCHIISGGTLHAAAWQGDEALVLRWVERADPEDLPPLLLSVDMHGATALHLAAMQGHESITRILVDEGSHVDALDNQDRTPLHLAAAAGHSDVVQLLGSKTVDGGAEAELEVEDNAGQTPLAAAAHHGKTAAALVLQALGADVDSIGINGQTVLHKAAAAGDLATLQLLCMDLSADVNLPVALPSQRRAIHLIAASSLSTPASEIISSLYKAKADVNAVDSAKDTALTLAIRSRTQQGTDAAGGWTERREGEARAAALVRSGASWQGVPGISSAEKSRYKTLRKEWEAEVQHEVAMEKSAASPRGAQAVLRRAELGQTLQVHLDGGRPCAKFVALVSDAQTALYVYDSDTGLEPETVHVLSQQRGHSVDAGEAPFSITLAPIGVLQLCGAEEMTSWLVALRECGLPSAAQQNATAAEQDRASLLGRNSGAPPPLPGQGAGGALSAASAARDQLRQNMVELGDMADKTNEMRENASSFAALATQARKQQGRSFFGI